MLRRACSIAIAPLLLSVIAIGRAGAQQPAPAGGKPPSSGGQQSRGPIAIQPGKSVWSRFSAPAIPKDVKEPTAAELAPQFDLEPGATQPDGVQRWRHRKTGMEFVFVPGGTFPMGSNYAEIYSNIQVQDSARRGSVQQTYFDSEQPQASVYLSPFFIGVFEVTNAEYRRFLEEVKAGKLDPACEWPFAPPAQNHVPYLWEQPQYPFWGDRQPIVGIQWLDAWAFARWMGGRLPTEAEWEKAARGTDSRLWPWGNQFDPMRANTAESSNRRTLDVGTYPGGRSVYGCYDLAGNVAEYCVDSHDMNSYRFRPAKDPCLLEREPPSDLRILRGGRWNRFGLLHTARCSGRGQIQMIVKYPAPDHPNLQFPVTEYLGTGLRVVLSPLIDLFPDGAVERLRTERAAAAEERRKAIERKRAEKGIATPDPAEEPKEGDGAGAGGAAGGGSKDERGGGGGR